MKVKLTKIGNSRGIRIPKPILRQCGIKDEVILEQEGNTIILRPITRKPRVGWEKQFEAMAKAGDDGLLDDEATTSSWDDDEWKW
jgi:antitoxin MazE